MLYAFYNYLKNHINIIINYIKSYVYKKLTYKINHYSERNVIQIDIQYLLQFNITESKTKISEIAFYIYLIFHNV